MTSSKLAIIIVYFSCLVYVPVDVVKERLQVQRGYGQNNQVAYPGLPIYGGSMDAFNKIFRMEGVKGMYKGYGATLASFGPFSALYFMFYEEVSEMILTYAIFILNYCII